MSRVQLLRRKSLILVLLFLCIGVSPRAIAENATGCLQALVEHGHYENLAAAEADPFMQRLVVEVERFQEGKTDSPSMTAELVPEFGTYRILPRRQATLSEAKVVFVTIHGNGGGNSGPHSLTAILKELVDAGVMSKDEASKIYAEAPALPGAEAGPNRDNFQSPELVAEWTVNYLRKIRSQMDPDAKLVVFTRSSGADFAIKASEIDPNLIDEIIAMSPTTTGIEPGDKQRLIDAEKGAIADLETNGSGVNEGAFSWIMKMLHNSKAWTVNLFKENRTRYTFFEGEADRQVPISERTFTSNLARDSDGNLVIYDFLRAHHDTFAFADGYNPNDQALPILRNYIREKFLGIPAPDSSIDANTFINASNSGKITGNKLNLGSEIPVTPKTLKEGYEAGFRFEAQEVFVVESLKAAEEHNQNSPHANTAVYIIASDQLARSFRRASGVPGFTTYRKNAKIPNFTEHAKHGRIRLKAADGSEKVLTPEDFVANDVMNHQEISSLAQEGRLVERQFQKGKTFYLPIYPSNFEIYRTWSKLSDKAKREYGLMHSRQDKSTINEPQASEDLLINFARSGSRGDISFLPEGMNAHTASQSEIESAIRPFPLQRFDPVYFGKYTEILDAAEKGKLYIVSNKGSIEYIRPDAIREQIAQPLASKKNAEDMVKNIISTESKAHSAGKDPTGNIFIIENGQARNINAEELLAIMGEPEESTLTFREDPLSPASLKFHSWIRKSTISLFRAEDKANYPEYQQALSNNQLSVKNDTHFWHLMNQAKNYLNSEGLPLYDVHSWLLPQTLFHERNAHSIEVFGEDGNLIAGAILLHKGTRWSIDALVDFNTPSTTAATPAPSAAMNQGLQKALFEAMEFAFNSGAEKVELERVNGQVIPLLGNNIIQNIEP
ncbi:MAG: hypothetical protein R3A80_11530 [Bdellovibrionota bacterium]